MVENNMILVTWDFTDVSEYALMHAQIAAKKLRTKVALLHITKKESEIPKAEARLKATIEEKYSDYNPMPEPLVLAGNIFTTISTAAEDHRAILVYMGTHGIKGSQKFFGSFALKVIAHSKVPFVVVQEPPKENHGFENLVFPLNYRKENKEALNWLTFFAKYFDSVFHFYKAKHIDQAFKKGVESNVLFITRNLKGKKIDYEIVDSPTEKDFPTCSINYAKKISANAIFVMTTKDIGLTDYMMGAHEQYIIDNPEKLPVICINPKPPKFGGSFSTSG